MKLTKMSPAFLGFLQATGLAIYVTLISMFFNFVAINVEHRIEQFYAPILMLLLFMISAVITATIFLGRAGILFWDKKYKEAFTLLGWTTAWGIFYLASFVFLSLR